MIEKLTNDQIDQVLTMQLLGRIGCSAGKKTYVVPVVYAFDGKYIYAHSKEGQKINIMRKNPAVCFQVDSIENLSNWRSVVIQGRYEELTSRAQQEKAMKLLTDKFAPLKTSTAAKPSYERIPGSGKIEKPLRAIIYRISIEEKTGRYEKD